MKALLPMRIQPLHNGHITLIKKLTEQFDELTILITNATEINRNNPFYGVERELILKKVIETEKIPNIKQIVQLPSFKDKKDWYNFVIDERLIDKQTTIILRSEYVKSKFEELGYSARLTNEFIDKIDISASRVREMIVTNNEEWKNFVPKETIDLIEKFDLSERVKSFHDIPIPNQDSPKFIISKSKIFDSLNQLKEIVDEVSYSWKTSPQVGEILNENESCYFSIHSLNELEQVRNKNKIWYFLFAAKEDELIKLKDLNMKNFVVDNLDDLKILTGFINKHNYKINLLLRMKLKENTLQTGKHYVFGMKSNIVKEQLKILRENKNIDQLGIHVHRKTQNVAEWNLTDEVSNVLGEEILEKIDVVNLGGGLPGKYKNIDDKLQESIFNKIKDFTNEVHKHNIKVIIEPGRFIASSAMKLQAKILAIHDNTIFLNCSIFNGALDTVVANIKLLVEEEKNSGNKFTLKGCTPDSSDILRYSVYLDNPKVGDTITFLNCGAYTYQTDFCALDKIPFEIED